MYDHVESFGKINRHGYSTVGVTELVKAPCDLVSKGEEGSGIGPVGTETMLSGATGRWLLSSASKRLIYMIIYIYSVLYDYMRRYILICSCIYSICN